jgi:hypothetical protein
METLNAGLIPKYTAKNDNKPIMHAEQHVSCQYLEKAQKSGISIVNTHTPARRHKRKDFEWLR